MNHYKSMKVSMNMATIRSFLPTSFIWFTEPYIANYEDFFVGYPFF